MPQLWARKAGAQVGSLDEGVAIVTGSGRGIGRSVALLLARQGAAVVVNDLGASLDGSGNDTGPAGDVVKEITASGGRATANGADISDHDAAEDLVQTAISTYGRLDILVNVAGILRDRMIFNMTADEWDAVIRVHLRGTFNTSKFAAAHWRGIRDETANNRIINFTSVSGLHGAPGQPNYAAPNAIPPGPAPRMTDSVPDERRRTPGTDTATTERSPDNVAPAVAYLASPRSRFITGQVIHAPGYESALYTHPAPPT